MRNHFFIIPFAAAALTASVCGQPDSIASYRDLENRTMAIISEALKNNPGLKASEYRVASAQAAIGYQKGIDPPLIGVDFYQSPVSTFPNPVKGQGEVDYSVQQMLPFPGKLSAMANVEKSRAAMAGSEKDALAQYLAAEVKAACYGLYLVQRKMRLNAENQDIAKNFVAIAAKQYELGMGKQSDVLRAQTELSLLAENGIALRQEEKSLEAKINALRSRPADAPVPLLPEIEPPAVALTFREVGPLAERGRPELKALEYAVAVHKNEEKAFSRERLPDFMVRGTYKQMMETPDYWSLMVGLTLPVAPWANPRYSSQAVKARADGLEAQEQYNNMKNEVLLQVQDALLAVQASQERIRLYKTTIIPQADQTLKASVAAYQTGKQDFFSLIDAERTLLSVKQDYHRAVYDLLYGIAMLERGAGMSVEDMEHALKGGTK